MKPEYLPSKYRKKDSLEYKSLKKEDQDLLNCVRHHTGIFSSNARDSVRTKCTHEENIYIPEKWIR